MPRKRVSRSWLILGVAAGLLVAGAANATILQYHATINAAQETPPSGTGGVGNANITIDTDANTLSYSIYYGNLGSAENNAHIHGYSVPGVASGVVHQLPTPTNPKVGVWNYPEANEAQILNGLTYVNIHTANFPAGEIRGQIIAGAALPFASPWAVALIGLLMVGLGSAMVLRRRTAFA